MCNERSPGPRTAKRRWQFPLWGLLLLTAVVACSLALAVQLPLVFKGLLILAAVVCVLTAILRFEELQELPLFAAVLWLAVGVLCTSLTVLGWYEILSELAAGFAPQTVPLGITAVMFVAALACLYRAGRSITLWFRRQTPTTEDQTTSDEH